MLPGVFERFTERARQVVVLAQEEARTLKHNYIGTEHILLGLVREEDGVAARVLKGLDITVETVRPEVVRRQMRDQISRRKTLVPPPSRLRVPAAAAEAKSGSVSNSS